MKSKKKYPVVRQERLDKKVYNKQLRRKLKTREYEGVRFKGSAYKKIGDGSYNWHYRWSYEDALDKYKNGDYFRSYFKSEGELKQYWLKVCIRK